MNVMTVIKCLGLRQSLKNTEKQPMRILNYSVTTLIMTRTVLLKMSVFIFMKNLKIASMDKVVRENCVCSSMGRLLMKKMKMMKNLMMMMICLLVME